MKFIVLCCLWYNFFPPSQMLTLNKYLIDHGMANVSCVWGMLVSTHTDISKWAESEASHLINLTSLIVFNFSHFEQQCCISCYLLPVAFFMFIVLPKLRTTCLPHLAALLHKTFYLLSYIVHLTNGRLSSFFLFLPSSLYYYFTIPRSEFF